MMRVDAHQHFWAIARGDYGWMHLSDKLAPLRRDFFPADFENHRAKYKIDRTVLVQAGPSIEETEYMLGLADATAWIAKVVGWVDFEVADHRRHLERWARHGKFSGVRPMIQDIEDTDWMLRPDVQWGYAATCALDLTFDALGLPRHLDNFLRLFDRYPKMRVVIDHGMKPAIRDDGFDNWATKMSAIAEKTGAYCKLSGLATEAHDGWNAATLQPYAQHIIDSFGADRVMWGSDWPVINLAGGYDAWAAAAEEIVKPADRDAIFGGTAKEFYRIG
ncbi:amidohydrolase [Dongia sp.]|uniref:amidohydrolase family protein n=1 Tax=Dongia sp. TaxID=1977262 RepID=UPI0035ADF927